MMTNKIEQILSDIRGIERAILGDREYKVLRDRYKQEREPKNISTRMEEIKMAATGNGTRVSRELEQWASSHETSYEIAIAINEIYKSANKMERVWQEPTPAEDWRIIQRAWELAGEDDAVLYWGESRVHRRRQRR